MNELSPKVGATVEVELADGTTTIGTVTEHLTDGSWVLDDETVVDPALLCWWVA
jgi:hypothetical protein